MATYFKAIKSQSDAEQSEERTDDDFEINSEVERVLSELRDHLRLKGYSPKTIKVYVNHCSRFFRNTQIPYLCESTY